jgi:hypothetical protein
MHAEWGMCHACKLKWRITPPFEPWPNMSDLEREATDVFLAGYREVSPDKLAKLSRERAALAIV